MSATSHKQSSYITKEGAQLEPRARWHVVIRDLYFSSAIHLPFPRVSPRSSGRMTPETVRSH